MNKQRLKKNFGSRGDKGNGISINMPKAVSAYTSIDAVVDRKVLVELFFIGIALTIISSSAAMIDIQKFSPLTILKERS